MKLRKKHARLVLFALQALTPATLDAENSLIRANLIDRITDRFPSLTRVEEPPVSKARARRTTRR